ncbi:hypothetical protein [Albimonas pacifica]|uniref:Uncharacterized protein n=1 Tax=Albimonas pacifica TaxID=1114924 RepID=A0A1I3JTT6_9RHOB|nr:hypothetical protein [Albimonas pacifica]SFI63671.1 hypothetical protein SAMN05216258_108154 [Albimonas pacifica]
MIRAAAVLAPVLALALLAPSSAAAACAGETVVSCPIGERRLEVCLEASDPPAFTYAYGPPGAPELTLREPLSAGTVMPWTGVGRSLWEAVAFRAGAYRYEVWHSLDRLTEDAPLEAGVSVLKGERLVASLTCRPGPGTVVAPIFTLSDAMIEAGWRWDLDARAWRRDAP